MHSPLYFETVRCFGRHTQIVLGPAQVSSLRTRLRPHSPTIRRLKVDYHHMFGGHPLPFSEASRPHRQIFFC